MKKVILTKKRLRALDFQLSINDILYEKFRRMQQELQREYRKLGDKKKILRVVQRRGGLNYNLPIQEVHHTGEGYIVVVA